jgi:hypothetical protein
MPTFAPRLDDRATPVATLDVRAFVVSGNGANGRDRLEGLDGRRRGDVAEMQNQFRLFSRQVR